MVDYTKRLSEQIVTVMDTYNNYGEIERIVISYGMELLLNSVLKTVIYLLVGLAIGKVMEVALAMAIFGSVRKLSGGRHAATDVGCFLMTGGIIFLSVISPCIVNISGQGYVLIIFVVNWIFIYWAPYDEYFEKAKNYDERVRIKLQSIFMINIIFLIGIFVNNYWQTIIYMTLVGQGITLIGGKGK